MLVELNATDIELIKQMIKLIELLKIDKHRYLIQIDGRISVNLKLYNPTICEHNTLIAHGGQTNKKTRTTMFSTRAEHQIYEFTYQGMRV